MLEKSCAIHTLYESEVSAEKVYNTFWESESRIIYVVDAVDRLTGVITNKNFMQRVRTGEPFINKEYSALRLKEETEVFREAEALFEKYNITTAIPVVDSEEKICYEIRRKRDSDGSFFVDFHHKIERYEGSSYLVQEIRYLREILSRQTVTVVGTKEQFERICGKLFQGTEHVIFFERIKNAFEFMSGHSGLLIDVSVTPYSGRNELYHFGINGYSCYSFVDTVIKMIELECFSRFYRVTGSLVATLKDYLEKYSDGRIYISSWGILTSAMKRYLSDSRLELIEHTGICREKSFQYYYIGNGVRINELTGGELLVMEQADVILQYYNISRGFARHVPVLNYVFDVNVQIPGQDTKEIISDKLFYLGEYVSDIEKGKEKRSYYKSETDSLSYLKALAPSFKLYATRRTENDLLVWRDYKSQYVNIINGVRKTCYQPEEYQGTIYCFGMCTMYGALVEDQYTIPSLLQKKINASGKKYRVVNMGNEIPANSKAVNDAMDLKPNDVVIILFPFVTDRVKSAIPFIEIGEDFNELWKRDFYGKDCFMDAIQHCGDYGNIIYSEIINKRLDRYLVCREDSHIKKNNPYDIFKVNTTDLDTLYSFDSFMEELQNEKKKIPADAKEIGCIVMNCNPITLGHRYLIEYANKCVDYLFIFVVEEDRSFFSFEDRFEMVKRATCGLEHVSVVRSGKLVISSNTFPTYFEKEDIKSEEKICLEEDIRIFAQYIAPILNISCRFIGEEPMDYVTGQYNIAMKSILPSMFGIRVVEIPRLKVENNVISATKVRELYGKKEFESMKKYVPDTTLNYLVETLQK